MIDYLCLERVLNLFRGVSTNNFDLDFLFRNLDRKFFRFTLEADKFSIYIDV